MNDSLRGLPRWAIGAMAAGAVLTLTFLVQHYRDAGRDRELEQLRGIIARDSVDRMAAVAKTDTSIAEADTATAKTKRAGTGWANAKQSAANATRPTPKPDTVRIRELVATVDTLRIAGDSLERAAAADTVAIAKLKANFLVERGAWERERNDTRKALDIAASRARHWGLGCSVGPSIVRGPTGIVRAGPIGATCGATYRW